MTQREALWLWEVYCTTVCIVQLHAETWLLYYLTARQDLPLSPGQLQELLEYGIPIVAGRHFVTSPPFDKRTHSVCELEVQDEAHARWRGGYPE